MKKSIPFGYILLDEKGRVIISIKSLDEEGYEDFVIKEIKLEVRKD